MAFELITSRLRLIPLSIEQICQYLERTHELEVAFGFQLSRANLNSDVRRAMMIKCSKMSEISPARHYWYTYWLIVVNRLNFGAGLVGFKGYPDSEDQVEIGYGIDPSVQGQGYTTEAARALIEWGFEQPDCRKILASIQRTNLASIRVAEKIGFHLVSEVETEQTWILEKPSTMI